MLDFLLGRRGHRHNHHEAPAQIEPPKLARDERRFKCIDERGNSVYEVGGWNGQVAFEEVIDPYGHRFIDVNPAHAMSVDTSDPAVMAKPVRVYAGDEDRYGNRRIGADVWGRGGTPVPRSKPILVGTFDTLSEAWDCMENDPMFGWDKDGEKLTFSCVTTSDKLDEAQAEICRAKERLEREEQERWNEQWRREQAEAKAAEQAEQAHREAARVRAAAVKTASPAFAGANEIIASAA
jgi:hypothetical protein